MKYIRTKIKHKQNKQAELNKEARLEMVHSNGKVTLNFDVARSWVKKATTNELEKAVLEARQELDSNGSKSAFCSDKIHACACELRNRSNIQSKVSSVNRFRKMSKLAQNMGPDRSEGYKEYTFRTFTPTNRDELSGRNNNNTEVRYRVLLDDGGVEIISVKVDGYNINMNTLTPEQKAYWLSNIEREASEDFVNRQSTQDFNVGEPSDDRETDGLPKREGVFRNNLETQEKPEKI